VLYELLTGRPPFDSEHTYEILDMVENHEPPRPSEISKYPVPKILEKLCLKCLNKDPAARPASMDELILMLEQDWASELLKKKS
jgi:serine/threonine protein kinase